MGARSDEEGVLHEIKTMIHRIKLGGCDAKSTLFVFIPCLLRFILPVNNRLF